MKPSGRRNVAGMPEARMISSRWWVPAAYRRQRVTQNSDGGQVHDVAHPDGSGGGDRVSGVIDADVRGEQEQLVGAVEGGRERRGIAQIAGEA
jgi:hypothetical protein